MFPGLKYGREYLRGVVMKMDSHIINYCFICKNHKPEENSGMDIYCGKEKIMVNNYVAQKCSANKYFERLNEIKS